jgi:predicted DNA-binding transcriptional regulator YafY
MVQANPLHHTQSSRLSKDGKTLAVEIFVYPSPELEIIIQGYGSAVKVIRPVTLAEKIADSARKVMALY